MIRGLEVQSLEARNLFAGIHAPLSHTATTVSASSPSYDPVGDLEYIHEVLGFSAAGQTIAIIDSGIAYDHYALGGGFGVGHRVVGGWDFAENDADPYDDGPLGYHGTHIAGIVGSDDEHVPGVAPGADLVALRVFDDFGASNFDWIESALAWVHDHRDSFENPITAVNLSIGAGINAEIVPDWTELEDEFETLESDGIFVAVAAGNGFREYGTAGLNYPAASPFVVAASSVNGAGELSDFSQRHERSLAAPGELINSTVPDYLYGFDGVTDDFARSSGTSMSTPFLAGGGMLVREAFARVGRDAYTADDIYDQLYDHADTIYDPATGADYKRVNLRATLNAIMATHERVEAPLNAVSPSFENMSVTALGQVDRATLFAPADRWFEFEAPETGIMVASNADVGVALFRSVTDSDEAEGLFAAVNETSFFTVAAGETIRMYVPASQVETRLQQVVSFDGGGMVVHGDRVSDNLFVSVGPGFIVASHGDVVEVDAGGRLAGQKFGDWEVEETSHGLVIRLQSAAAIRAEGATDTRRGANDGRSPAPHAASIYVGCGLASAEGSLLSEQAADAMFAAIEFPRSDGAAIALPARLLDELYSRRQTKVTTTSLDALPEQRTMQTDHESVDSAIITRLNRF